MVRVKQGSILKLSLDPKLGHEQAGYRPVVVVSGDQFNSISKNMAVICTISTTSHKYPLHVELDDRTKTKGVIQCDHINALDIKYRGYKYIEDVPKDVLAEVLKKIEALLND